MTFHVVPSAAWFRRALQTLGRVYRFISVDDLHAYFYEGRRFNGCCHICFDDGERSFHDLALPVLEDLAVPATLFVSPGVLGGERNYWFQEVRFLRKQVGDAAIKHEIAGVLGWDDAQSRAVFDQHASQKPAPGRYLACDRRNPAAASPAHGAPLQHQPG